MPINRRTFLQSLAATGVGVAGLASGVGLAAVFEATRRPSAAGVVEYDLTAAPADFEVLPGKVTHGLGFNGGFPAPVLRARQGQLLRIRFHNQLSEPTTIHWHGLRLPVGMDGVPEVTQAPVQPGETFVYEFVPPDAGTFWYHPHMNSIEQLGRGLVGALVVDEVDDPGFDVDELLLLKNWHLSESGEFGPQSIKRYAARQGTPGQTFSVNGQVAPEYTLPAGASVRLRLLNADNTWVYDVSLSGAEALVMARDANPVVPEPLSVYVLGAGMRMDLGILVPNEPGRVLELKHQNRVLARFVVGKAIGATRLVLPELPDNPIAAPDLANAEELFFSFEWDAVSDEQGRPLFWNLKGPKNQRPAYCTNANLLASLKHNKSYIFTLRNNTQYPHPIHLHGHTFRVLDSNKQKIQPHFADTVILDKNEQVRIAFVADNPGRWMFHCHVIEHMAMGLVGMIDVV